MSPAIARVDNFDNRNLCNNFSNNSPIYHDLEIKKNHRSKWITCMYHMINHKSKYHSSIKLILNEYVMGKQLLIKENFITVKRLNNNQVYTEQLTQSNNYNNY